MIFRNTMAENTSLTSDEQQKLKLLLKLINNGGELKAEQEELDKAEDCVGEKDIQRIIDLGLGRGVDATDPTPWKNKTSFQVRPVIIENIIGTEEGGCVQSYEKEVTSLSEIRGLASASVTNPKTAVSIGVEGEYSHSSSSRYRVVGTKVLNRTISFKDHCDDGELQPQLESHSFEAWLCKWILRQADVDVDSEKKKQAQELANVETRRSALENSLEVSKAKLKEHWHEVEEIQLKLLDTERMHDDIQRAGASLQRGISAAELERHSACRSPMINDLEHENPYYATVPIEIESTDNKIKRRIMKQTDFMSEMASIEQEAMLHASKELHSLGLQSLKLKAQVEERKSNKSTTQSFTKQKIDEGKIVNYCTKFITQFHITHYVSSIQLGASGYEVLTESKLSRKLGIGSHVGVEKIAAGSLSTTHSRSHGSSASNVRRIGVIELKDGIPTVKRGSHQEAVVGIQVKPISDLILTRELRTPLKKALLKYLRSEGETCAGPFLIHCATSGAMSLYWTVDEFHHVLAASKKENASKFYIKPSNDPKYPDEFYICYYDADISELRDKDTSYQFDETKEFVEPIPRYLVTPTDAFGCNPGPLVLKYQVRSRDTRLVLVSCVRKRHQPPVSLSEWMSGREMCFIQCARRKHMKGYIAITQSYCFSEHYQTCCVHSKHKEDECTYFMLFQTVRTLETRTDKAMKKAAQAGVIDYEIPGQILITTHETPRLTASSLGFKNEAAVIEIPIPQQPHPRPPPPRPTKRLLPVKPPPPLPPKPSAEFLPQAEATGAENESEYDSVHCSDYECDVIA